MAIAVQCPECGHAFSVRDEYAGKRGKCPRCGGVFRADAPAEDVADESPLIVTNGSSARRNGSHANGSSSRVGFTAPVSISAMPTSPATSSIYSGGGHGSAYRKPRGVPLWGWIAIAVMALATGGALTAASLLPPDTDDITKEAKERSKMAKKAAVAVAENIDEVLTQVEDTIAPLEKRIEEATRERTIEDDVMPAIVKVINMRNGQPNGTGTGWFFKAGDRLLVATNHHVVNLATSLVIELQNEKKYDIEGFVADDTSWDLCILKPRDDEIPTARPLRIASGDEMLSVGDTVFAAGNPGAHRHVLTKGVITRKVSNGRVQEEGNQTSWAWNVDPNQDIMWISHDARIFPGNSGGPLLNDDLEVIGVNTQGLMCLMQRPSILSRRGVRLMPTFGLASNSTYILDMVQKNKDGTVKPLSELKVMNLH